MKGKLLVQSVLLSSCAILASGCAVPTAGGYYESPYQKLQRLEADYRRSLTDSLAADADTINQVVKVSGVDGAIEKLKESLVTDFKDPDSVKFRSLKLVDYKQSKVLCGELNGKNSYGAYVGYRPFAASLQRVLVLSNSSSTSEIEYSVYREVCLKASNS